MQTRSSVLGTFINMTDPTVVDVAGLAGFDFVVAECEHGSLGLETIAHHIRAARNWDLGFMVRVPAGDWSFIQRVLDAGADGVLVPHVSGAAEATRAVAAVRYPPQGRRGMYSKGLVAKDYSTAREMTAERNAETVLNIIVEDASAVADIDEILAVPGIDVVTLGTSDLAASLGAVDQPDDARLAKAVDAVLSACRSANVPVAMPVHQSSYPRSAEELRDLGIWMLTIGGDADALLSGWRAVVEASRPRDATSLR